MRSLRPPGDGSRIAAGADAYGGTHLRRIACAARGKDNRCALPASVELSAQSASGRLGLLRFGSRRSNRLVDALVIHAPPETVVTGLTAHLEAGADHLAVYVLDNDPVDSWRQLANLLL